MNSGTQRLTVPGPAGTLECAVDAPDSATQGLAVLCHPHPLHGGSMDNKVVHTLARAFVQMGWRVVRFNFRGVGGSSGTWDNGVGEVDDALAVIQACRASNEPLVLAGFSFGGFVASSAAQRLPEAQGAKLLVLIAPAVEHFKVANVPSDTLVVHGENDEIVPLAALFNWARPQGLPVTVIPGATHFFHGRLPLLKNIVSQVLR